MKHDDAEEYTEALGQVLGGSWRQIALGKRLGVPVALGLTTEAWVQERLGGYVRLGIPDRREAVAELTEQGMSTREIEDVLGVDHATVARDVAVANATSEPEEARDPAGVEELPVANATPEPQQPEPEIPTPDELAGEDVRLRRSSARKMLTQAAKATSALSPSVDSVAEAVLALAPDELAAERQRITRNRQVWDRLVSAIDQQGNSQLRRVK